MTFDQIKESQRVIDSRRPDLGQGTVVDKLKTIIKVVFDSQPDCASIYNCFSVSSLEEVAHG